ncbi:hypothetical protein GGX14DRAFT_391642 [Mycena pura]|uniref:Uncharacterized protein n=1 Tax=Mycena pura TaxID=153505 RepID=A0AAD6VPV9_9AGAR|nr:hypothetical protein GGX14DRAFT_391642 [Mycena pura]
MVSKDHGCFGHTLASKNHIYCLTLSRSGPVATRDTPEPISHISRGITKSAVSSARPPRKNPAVPVQNHYSKDLKQRVIYQAYTLEKGSTEIAIDLNMPLRVVQRIKQTWAEIGSNETSAEMSMLAGESSGAGEWPERTSCGDSISGVGVLQSVLAIRLDFLRAEAVFLSPMVGVCGRRQRSDLVMPREM